MCIPGAVVVAALVDLGGFVTIVAFPILMIQLENLVLIDDQNWLYY